MRVTMLMNLRSLTRRLAGLALLIGVPAAASAQAPTITSISPDFGFTRGGTAVTLTGTNFTGATGVTLGGAAMQSFTVVGAGQIDAVTPPGSGGLADLAVTAPGGTATRSGAFTYIRAGSWTPTPPAPDNVTTGGNAVKAGNSIYVLQGGTVKFWSFGLTDASWTVLADFPFVANNGSALAYPGAGDFLYASRGGAAQFARYQISTDTWSDAAVADLPAGTFGAGASLVANATDVYALLGGGTGTFYRYNIANNRWNNAADGGDPADYGVACGSGASLVWNGGDLIYGLRGGGNTTFRRFRISTPAAAWTALSAFVAVSSGGGKLAYANVGGTDYVYALRGSGTVNARRYNVGTNAWDDAGFAEAPAAVAGGGFLVAASNAALYGARGNGTAEFWLYDTASNTWQQSKVADAPGVVNGGGAVVSEGVGHGVFYAFQGATAAFWKYDTRTNAWTVLGSPATGARGAGAALAYTGGDFIYAFRGGATTTFERYSLGGGAWSDAAVADPPAAVGAGGSLVWTGGNDLYAVAGGGTRTFWRYNIPNDRWNDAADGGDPTDLPGGVTVGDGGALAYPGAGDFVYALRGGGSTAFLSYRISTNTWSNAAVANPPVAAGPGGSLCAPGGDFLYAVLGNTTTNFYRYSISGDAWTALSAMPAAVAAGGAMTCASQPALHRLHFNDYLLALRGSNTATVWQYGLHGTEAFSGGAWTAAAPLNVPRAGHTSTAVGATGTLVVGGHTGEQPIAQVERYDAATGLWTVTASLAVARSYHTATRLAGGAVLIAGGYDAGSAALASAELYDPSTDTLTPAGTMTGGPRVGHTATLLSDGRVLVAGGEDGMGNALDTTTLFTAPATWTAGPNLGTARAYLASSDRLSDNDVLFIGGWQSGAYLSSVDRWDQATGTIAPTGAMAGTRMSHQAVTLNAGADVLVCGGWDGTQVVATAEQYSAAGGAWTSAGSMSTPRADHRAAATAANAVLVCGGWKDPSPLSGVTGIEGLDSAETWTFGAPGVWAASGTIGMKKWEHGLAQAGIGANWVQEGGWFLGAAAAKLAWPPVSETPGARPVKAFLRRGVPLVPVALRKSLPAGTSVRMAGEVQGITDTAGRYRPGGGPAAPADGFFPAGGAAVATPFPGFRWNPAPGASDGLSYEVRLDADGEVIETFQRRILTAPGARTADGGPEPLAAGGVYAWAVRSRDADGAVSDWSPLQTFIVALASVPPPRDVEGERGRDVLRVRWRPVRGSEPAGWRFRLWSDGRLVHGPADVPAHVRRAAVRGIAPSSSCVAAVSAVDDAGVESEPALARSDARRRAADGSDADGGADLDKAGTEAGGNGGDVEAMFDAGGEERSATCWAAGDGGGAPVLPLALGVLVAAAGRRPRVRMRSAGARIIWAFFHKTVCPALPPC